MLGDDMSQELNLVLAQGALVCIHYQTILEEALEQDVEVVEVFLFVIGGNQDIIQVDEKEGNPGPPVPCASTSGKPVLSS